MVFGKWNWESGCLEIGVERNCFAVKKAEVRSVDHDGKSKALDDTRDFRFSKVVIGL